MALRLLMRNSVAMRPQASGLQLWRSYCAAAESNPAQDRIKKLVNDNKLVVFMKGVPEAPQCGFSNNVAQLLRMHGQSNYTAVNVLEDQDIREGVKQFSNWPTIPQVYLNGEFIGGCDIMMSMYKSGELTSTLRAAGLEAEEPSTD
mmetsp:Transcript_13358/g.14971  ORF Transcript_13358/g.14971 Transcript_13358/m.14971 type:complete len:146 (-) Transcript_13358:22-459(-)